MSCGVIYFYIVKPFNTKNFIQNSSQVAVELILTTIKMYVQRKENSNIYNIKK